MSIAAERDHDVLRVLGERVTAGSTPGQRADGLRVALAIEGGGNRGVISGGMAAALDEAGLLPAFDAVYGSSSGTLTAAWLLSAHVQTGLQGWTEPEKYARMSRPWNPLTRRPLFDLQWLIEEFYDRTLGLDADHILANPISLHPLATDAATGESVDLGPLVRDRASLHLAMRASAALPILAGKPVRLGGRNFLDAGLAESIPLDTPIAAGATHVLVLTSRRRGETTSDSPAVRWVTDRWLRRAAPGARAAFADRNARGLVIAERLAHYNTAAGATPSVMAVHPAPDSPDVGRSESDAAVMRAGARAGGDAMRRALAGMLEQR